MIWSLMTWNKYTIVLLGKESFPLLKHIIQ